MIKNVAISLLCGVLGAMIFTIAQNRLYHQTEGVVNVNAIISEHIKTYANKDLSDKDREKLSEKFSSTLESVIDRVSQEERVVLFVKPAALTKLPDYTDYIKNEVDKEINE